MVMPFLRPEESGGIQALEQGAWKGTFMAMVEYALRADTMAFLLLYRVCGPWDFSCG